MPLISWPRAGTRTSISKPTERRSRGRTNRRHRRKSTLITPAQHGQAEEGPEALLLEKEIRVVEAIGGEDRARRVDHDHAEPGQDHDDQEEDVVGTDLARHESLGGVSEDPPEAPPRRRGRSPRPEWNISPLAPLAPLAIRYRLAPGHSARSWASSSSTRRHGRLRRGARSRGTCRTRRRPARAAPCPRPPASADRPRHGLLHRAGPSWPRRPGERRLDRLAALADGQHGRALRAAGARRLAKSPCPCRGLPESGRPARRIPRGTSAAASTLVPLESSMKRTPGLRDELRAVRQAAERPAGRRRSLGATRRRTRRRRSPRGRSPGCAPRSASAPPGRPACPRAARRG